MEGGCTNYYDKVEPKFAGYARTISLRAGRGSCRRPWCVTAATWRPMSCSCPATSISAHTWTRAPWWIPGPRWVPVPRSARTYTSPAASAWWGVLEPLQANPTIIEDNCFIGARSEVVEGVVVGEGSVISMGVYIGQSTRIYNRDTGEISYGRVPPGSVVVSREPAF